MSQMWLEEVQKVVILVTMKGLSLHMKSSLYAVCVRSVMLYGSEMLVVNEKDVYRQE